MSLDLLTDRLGGPHLAALGGLLIGILFGVLAQRSRFCLRSACLEVAHQQLGGRLAVWLLTFSAALMATQALVLAGLFDGGAVRQLNNRGSLSGAIVGGLVFGCGMTLTRACASRMVVLAATGNLRALLSGLVFAVAAQASMSGILSPLRDAVAGWWTIEGYLRDMLAYTGVGHGGGLAFGAAWFAAGAVIAWRNRIPLGWWLAGTGVGLTVALAWWFNYSVAAVSFEPIEVHSLSFSAPSMEMLMAILSPPGDHWSFNLALIPGVALGSLAAGLWSREWKLEGFHDGSSMRRYIIGGCLMGFGAVLAGGCAVGAGVSGASVFAITAWLVLWSMWIGAVLTDWLVDGGRLLRPHRPAAAPAPSRASEAG